MTLRTILLLGSLAMPSLAFAAAPAASSEIRLSQAEIDRVLADAAAKREARPRPLPIAGEPVEQRKVHGEVGFEIGSDGYRSVYGTSALELPDGGFAIVSFQTARRRGEQDYYLPRDR